MDLKYTLPLIFSALAACGPRSEYQPPFKGTSLEALVEKPEAEISSARELGEITVAVAEEFVKQAQCSSLQPDFKDCYGSMPLSQLLTVVRVTYHGNEVAMEVEPNYNGKMGDIKTPSGEIKTGKIENKQIVVARVEPPEQLYRQLKGRLTLYDLNPQTNKLEITRVIDINRCFRPDGQEFLPNVAGNCRSEPEDKIKTKWL